MKFQLKLRTEVILFCSLVLFNSMLIIRAAQRETYQDAFRIALLCYTGILLGLATYVRVKSEVSVWEGHVNDMLYLGMALPGVAMLFRAVTPKAEEFLVPGAFEISCLIVFYLMMTGRLSNVTNIIRETFIISVISLRFCLTTECVTGMPMPVPDDGFRKLWGN